MSQFAILQQTGPRIGSKGNVLVTNGYGLAEDSGLPPGSGSGTLPASNVAAAGTTQGTGTALGVNRNYVTSGTGGVVLPQASTFANNIVPVCNCTTSAITLYPHSGDQIGSNGVNVGIPLAAGATALASVDASGIVRIW